MLPATAATAGAMVTNTKVNQVYITYDTNNKRCTVSKACTSTNSEPPSAVTKL